MLLDRALEFATAKLRSETRYMRYACLCAAHIVFYVLCTVLLCSNIVMVQQ